MKFPIAYYLLLLYLTVILRPLLPLASDAWGHTFNEAIHIATVHAKYGANHLQSVLADNAAQNNSNGKTQNTIKFGEDVPVHLTACNHHDLSYPASHKICPQCFYNDTALRGHNSIFLPPPKIS